MGIFLPTHNNEDDHHCVHLRGVVIGCVVTPQPNHALDQLWCSKQEQSKWSWAHIFNKSGRNQCLRCHRWLFSPSIMKFVTTLHIPFAALVPIPYSHYDLMSILGRIYTMLCLLLQFVGALATAS